MEMGIIYAIISFTIINLLVIITSGKETLRLGAMISQEGPFGLTGFLPAMELALETIKEDETLPFEFEITLNDSMVNEIAKRQCSCICVYSYSSYMSSLFSQHKMYSFYRYTHLSYKHTTYKAKSYGLIIR